MKHITKPHKDALIINVDINDFDVKRISVDSEILTNVLVLDVVLFMRMTNKDFEKLEILLI